MEWCEIAAQLLPEQMHLRRLKCFEKFVKIEAPCHRGSMGQEFKLECIRILRDLCHRLVLKLNLSDKLFSVWRTSNQDFEMTGFHEFTSFRSTRSEPSVTPRIPRT